MVSRNIFIIMAILALLLIGCKPASQINETSNESVSMELPEVESEGTPRGKEISAEDFNVVVTGVEGEVIELKPQAVDPDDDRVMYMFSAPFADNGKWQTKVGDEGDYIINVVASDGLEETTQDVLVRVLRSNRPPMFDCPEMIVAKEGEMIKVTCEAFDEEGDEIMVTYKGFMTSSQKMLSFEDAGSHKVIVTAWDAANSDDKINEEITIEVQDVNRAPELDLGRDSISGFEGDVLTLDAEVFDPDGDDVSVTFSAPFGRDGVWRTEIGDAGTYDAKVVASDGENVVEGMVRVTVEQSNTAPVFITKLPDVIDVKEGETISLDVEAKDREGDAVSILVSGFMNDLEYTTTYDDGYPNGCSEKLCRATYTVTVTASDGVAGTSHEILVQVQDRNRPPVFRVPA